MATMMVTHTLPLSLVLTLGYHTTFAQSRLLPVNLLNSNSTQLGT